jgi:uncharacterized protein (DUF4213/DUF364 family)
MRILEEIIDGLDMRNLMLEEIVIGLHVVLASSNAGTGLATNLVNSMVSGTGCRQAGLEKSGSLHELSAIEACRYALSENLLQATVGMAAVNSFIAGDPEKYRDLNAFNLIAEKGAGKHIAVIGGFPFVSKLRDTAGILSVFELNASSEEEIPAERMPQILPYADLVAITSTTLINHTLEDILALTGPRTYRILLGPSTPMTEVLFDHGLHALCGSVVEDHDLALRHITQGASFRQVKGVRHVAMTR